MKLMNKINQSIYLSLSDTKKRVVEGTIHNVTLKGRTMKGRAEVGGAIFPVTCEVGGFYWEIAQ